MVDDDGGFDLPDRLPATSTAQRAHHRRVLVALLRLHSDAFVLRRLNEHQQLDPDRRRLMEAVVPADHEFAFAG